MKLNYINKIRKNISIYSSKKTTNLLNGTYSSIYKGKSLNFENLREYVINDEIKDIDWKASARSGDLLVREYIAEKKHNILFILDTGEKINADTDYKESKLDILLQTFGTLGYLAINNGDYVGMLYSTNKLTNFYPFRGNLYNLEDYICKYHKNFNYEGNLNDTLEFALKNIKKRMIIFVITDIGGISQLNNNTLKKISKFHDTMIININDNYISDSQAYDIRRKTYIPNCFSKDKNLIAIEKNIRINMLRDNNLKLQRYGINMCSISRMNDINNQLIKLLEEHRNGSRKRY